MKKLTKENEKVKDVLDEDVLMKGGLAEFSDSKTEKDKFINDAAAAYLKGKKAYKRYIKDKKNENIRLIMSSVINDARGSIAADANVIANIIANKIFKLFDLTGARIDYIKSKTDEIFRMSENLTNDNACIIRILNTLNKSSDLINQQLSAIMISQNEIKKIISHQSTDGVTSTSDELGYGDYRFVDSRRELIGLTEYAESNGGREKTFGYARCGKILCVIVKGTYYLVGNPKVTLYNYINAYRKRDGLGKISRADYGQLPIMPLDIVKVESSRKPEVGKNDVIPSSQLPVIPSDYNDNDDVDSTANED